MFRIDIKPILAKQNSLTLHVRERSKAGVEAARARGKVGGRPIGLSKAAKEKALTAAILYKEGRSISQIREALKIGSNSTIYRYLRNEGIEINGLHQFLKLIDGRC